jgi:hypothetical protein
MNKILLPLLLLLVSTVTAFGDELRTYPIPKGAPENHDFTVEVRQGNGSWQPVGTYEWNVDRTDVGRHNIEKSSVASFDVAGPVEVRVTWLRGNIQTAVVRPLSYGIKATQEGNTINFTLDRPRYVSVEVNGDRYHNLQLFANPLPPKVKRGKNVVVIKPGYYDLKKDSIALRSGQTLYISGGAYIKGFISVTDVKGARVIGTGIVNPERQHEGILIRRSHDIVIDGPLTTQIPCGESDSVVIRNAKVISWYGWGDGMNVFASNNVNYNHVFCRTSDDCSTIYCTRLGYRGSCHNINVDDAVYWADVAHPIMIGLHGNIEKNEEVSNVTYSNVDILKQKEMQVDYQGCIGINCGDNIWVHNITFRNFHIEELEEGMLFNFRVCYNKKYCHAPGRGISDIVLDSIQYDGKQPNLSIIAGYSDDRTVNNITFKNLIINGLHIFDKMKGKPGYYKTADFAHLFIGEHVSNVTFE